MKEHIFVIEVNLLSLWVRKINIERKANTNHMLDVVKKPYKGVELKAAPELWKVRLDPSKYQRVIDIDGYADIHVWKSFILYMGDISEITSDWVFSYNKRSRKAIHSEVAICSESIPIFLVI